MPAKHRRSRYQDPGMHRTPTVSLAVNTIQDCKFDFYTMHIALRNTHSESCNTLTPYHRGLATTICHCSFGSTAL
ncbi:protein of unknown function [Rhodovastum atsumiense]|nr:protein of unknown function [Rhodovastum atsumiense]